MRLTRRDPSTLHARAFCLSSVWLWCDPARDSIREVAGVIDEGGETAAESLCIARARGSELRAWFPYIAATSNDSTPLIRLFQWTWSELSSAPTPATAFVELGSPVAELLVQAGWHLERDFLVQVSWPNLGAWTSTGSPLPEDIAIDVDPGLEEVVRLFVGAFLCE